MQVNSINNSNQAFKARVMVNTEVLSKAEKEAMKPVLDLVENNSIEEGVLRNFMANMPKLNQVFSRMLNSAKSPVQAEFNSKMNIMA